MASCRNYLVFKNLKGSDGSPVQILLGSGVSADSYSVEDLYNDLVQLHSKGQLDSLLESIDKEFDLAKSNMPTEFKPLVKSQTQTALHAFTEHMKTLGVKVIEERNVEDASKTAWVENGEIHINMHSSCVTAPMHELMHLVFGVMKVQDYKAFSRLMNSMRNVKPFQQLLTEITANPEYQNMMEYDRFEEAMCRMFEELVSDAEGHGFQLDDIPYDFINRILNPFISTTFGIETVPDLIRFLHSTMSDLPVLGSTLFLRSKQQTTGYSKNQEDVKLAGRITNLIQKWVTDGVIEEKCYG